MRARAWGAGVAVVSATRQATAQSNPFATSTSSTSPPGNPIQAAVDAACGHITSALCGQQNTPMIATAAGYVVVSTLIVLVWRASWEKRGTNTGGVRFLVPMTVGAALAGTLTGLDPARGDALRCCLANAVFRPEILLADSAIGRAFLFGVLPAMMLYTLGAFISGMLKH